MSPSGTPRRRGPVRRIARLVYEEVGMSDRPVISGLVDLEGEHRWQHRD